MMTNLVVVFGTSLAVCLLVTPGVRVLAARCGLVDRPDGRRKIHLRPTPLAGGLALLVAVLVGLSFALAGSEPVRDEFRADLGPFLGLLAAALVICLVGVADDFGCLRGRQKLAGQVVAIAIVIASGVLVRRVQVFQWEAELGPLAVPFTAFLLLGAVNSLNLLDGMDGLLSAVGLIILSAMAVMAVLGGHLPAALVAVALAGALVGFLRYNLPPASIFLGDCGSMLIGLAVGVLAIQCSFKGPATAALAAPLAALTIPIMDTTAAIVRRKLTGRSLYVTDRGHLHHCLLNRGLSVRCALGAICFLCLSTVVGAVASLALRNELVAFLTAAVVVSILVGMRLFGYAEFVLARDRLVAAAGSFLRIRPNDQPYASEVRLQGSMQWGDAWERLTACASELNLKTVRFDLNAPFIHEGYHARWDSPGDLGPEEARPWSARIPLVANGHVIGRLEVTGGRDDTPVWTKIAALAELAELVEETVSRSAEAVHTPPEPARPLPQAVMYLDPARLE